MSNNIYDEDDLYDEPEYGGEKNNTSALQKKTIDLGEAFTAAFKPGWAGKLGTLFLLLIPMIIWQLAIPQMGKFITGGITSAISGILATVVMFIIMMVCGVIISGYYILYAHDRALDRNAEMRNILDCVPDAFFAGVKNIILGIVVSVPLLLAAIIPLIICGIITGFLPVLGFILSFIVWFTVIIIGVRIYLTLYPYFAKDLKLVSMFQWRKAFQFSKGVGYGPLNLLLLFLGTVGIYIGGFILLILVGGMLGVTGGIAKADSNAISSVAGVIGSIGGFLLQYYISLMWSSAFGQYAYNAIAENMKVQPETLPKFINRDKVATIAVSVAIFVIYMVLVLAPALVLPSLINRQNEVMSTVVIKKAIANYEYVASVYMSENKTSNVRDMMGYNCQNAPYYFKIMEQKGCNFVTVDGAYWQFDANTGSAYISDKVNNPKYRIKVGVCYDGTVNCPYDYPEVNEFMEGGSKY